MKEILTQYYGLDWIAMITSFLFIYFIGNKKRYAFLLGIISAIAWIFTNGMAGVWAGVILNVVLVVLHMRGYMKWKPRK